MSELPLHMCLDADRHQLLKPVRKLLRCTDRCSSQFENTYSTEMCRGSEAGSYLRLGDFVYHSTLGLRVILKKKKLLTPVRELLWRAPAAFGMRAKKKDTCEWL